MILDPTKEDPIHVNEAGVKWWNDESTTSFATMPDLHGTKLNARGYFAETPEGYKTRILIDNNTNAIIAEDTSIEGMGVAIDILKARKRFKC